MYFLHLLYQILVIDLVAGWWLVSHSLGLFLFPWLVAYFYKKMNYKPWTFKSRSVSIPVSVQSDFVRNKPI